MIVRAGDRSLHRTWLAGTGSNRNFDLHVSYFGDRPDELDLGAPDVTMTHEKGSKFKGLHACLAKLGDRVTEYDYVGFPDDDLQATQAVWDRFSDVLLEYKPAIAQPALTLDSFWSHDIVLQRKRYKLRYVDMVEVMTPFIRTSLLEKYRGKFNDNESGWGLDWAWSKDHAADRGLMIVDSCAVLHTRAVGSGALYKKIEQNAGRSAWDELHEFVAESSINHSEHRSLAAVRHGGELQNLVNGLRPLILPRIRRKFRDIVGKKLVA